MDKCWTVNLKFKKDIQCIFGNVEDDFEIKKIHIYENKEYNEESLALCLQRVVIRKNHILDTMDMKEKLRLVIEHYEQS